MPSVLLSGPAGAGKSAVARRLIAESMGLAVLADFQSIYAAVSGATRDPDTGLYPERIEALLPITEFVRQAVVRGAVERELDVVLTNSDGSPERRAFLLGLLGRGATERIVDPGREVVSARLADPSTGQLSDQCSLAVGRWYDRLGGT